MVFRTPYNNPPPRVAISEFGPSRTKQQDKKGADINWIMARYEKTGIAPVADKVAAFLDVSEIGDFRAAVDKVMVAEKLFAGLPARVRERFGNDPELFVREMKDPNMSEARRAEFTELGLFAKPEPRRPPLEVRVVADDSAKA